MKILLMLMLMSLLFPLIKSFRSREMRERMLCYTSLSTRIAVCLILFSVLQEDYMIGMVAVIVLSLGNSGLMLLVHLLQGLEEEWE